MIGKRVVIEYDDQNETFAALLPRSGRIVNQFTTLEGVDDWLQVKLDDPVDYQLGSMKPFSFRLIHCSSVLIRSRLLGVQIGREEKVSIFIMLIPDEHLLEEQPIDISRFYHVAWGLCSIIRAVASS
jgi:hypothetical protein